MHRYHPDPEKNDPRDAILYDECQGCALHVKTHGLNLDVDNWRRMYSRMLDVEIFQTEEYRSASEGSLGNYMYGIYVAIERYTNINPQKLFS